MPADPAPRMATLLRRCSFFAISRRSRVGTKGDARRKPSCEDTGANARDAERGKQLVDRSSLARAPERGALAIAAMRMYKEVATDYWITFTGSASARRHVWSGMSTASSLQEASEVARERMSAEPAPVLVQQLALPPSAGVNFAQDRTHPSGAVSKTAMISSFWKLNSSSSVAA